VDPIPLKGNRHQVEKQCDAELVDINAKCTVARWTEYRNETARQEAPSSNPCGAFMPDNQEAAAMKKHPLNTETH
jgi:hypothetical protein